MSNQGTMLLCGCEGYEHELLRPDVVPQLSAATILVELHPMFSPGVGAATRARFEPSHDLELIRMQPREVASWPELAPLPERDAFLVVSEGWNSDEEWGSPDFKRRSAFMTPRR